MSEIESDDDLQKAIALSLEPDTSIHDVSVIDLISSDTEDDDLDAPSIIRTIDQPLSMDRVTPEIQNGANSSKRTPEIDLGVLKADIPQTVPQGFLSGLDRRKMESERLLRAHQREKGEGVQSQGGEARKRKFGTSSLDPSDESERNVRAKHLMKSHISDAALSGTEPVPPAARAAGLPILPGKSDILPMHPMNVEQALDLRNDAKTKQQSQGLLSCKDQQSLISSSIQFPDGVVKKTWAYGCPRADDIKIEEVFQKSDLELAVLSAFQVDPEWVESKLTPQTKVIWVLQAKTEEDKRNIRADAPPNYRFCFPSMSGNINCMHSKLQLLAHPTHLRICIPSANLVPYDWGESGIMENVCFLIDLPRLPEGSVVEREQMTNFGKELLHYLKALGLEESVTRSVRKFDFSRTSHLAFIHTIGGSHSGEDWQRTGYCGLGNAVRKLGLHTDGPVNVDFVAASIGNINLGFLKSIYLAAKGDDGLTEYEWRTSKTSKNKAETPKERKVSEEVKKNFRIYFPTWETVARSKGGIGAGGTIFLQSKWYESETFPKLAMRDCKSHRTGMLMHNKMLFVRQSNIAPAECKGWAYVGSANCSEAAWGRLVKDKSAKGPKLNCRNWECGVLIQAAIQTSKTSANKLLAHDDPAGLEIFRGAVPVPMIVPGEEYGERKPWFMNEQ